MKQLGRLTLLALLALATMHGPADAATPAETGAAIQQILADATAPDIDTASLNSSALKLFYGLRHGEPCWSGNPVAETAALSAIAALEHADREGLVPQDYHADNALMRSTDTSPVQAAEREILITDGILRYAHDVHSGRAELRALDKDVDLPASAFSAPVALDAALQNGRLPAFLDELAPPHPQYAQLKAALAHYRAIAANGDWPQLTFVIAGKSRSVDRALLTQRLAFEDSTLASTAAPTGDDIEEAVKRFQLRHALPADGRIGQTTLAALNVSASERAMEIVANMERWRWLPEQLEPVHVEVNAPDARLDLIVDGAAVLTSRVIVGRPRDRTPILRAQAISVTINPPWNIPGPIARREIWPKLRRHGTYLLAHDMVLVDGPAGDPHGLGINWRALKTFPYRVRQLPGPKNALGQIKLELPNRFDVYLHDTPGKSAFNLDERHLSHGCVRVQQIVPLASYALSGDASAMVDKLNAAIADPTTQHLPLKKPLPIYLLYWTAFADADGAIAFRPDIYGRDERLITAAAGRAAAQHMTALALQCHAG